jgi:hypothetical protein
MNNNKPPTPPPAPKPATEQDHTELGKKIEQIVKGGAK